MSGIDRFNSYVLKNTKLLYGAEKGSNVARQAIADQQGVIFRPVSAKKNNSLITTYKEAIAAIEITMRQIIDNAVVEYLLNFNLNNKQEQVEDFPCEYVPCFMKKELELEPLTKPQQVDENIKIIKVAITDMIAEMDKSLTLTKNEKSCDLIFTAIIGDPILVRAAGTSFGSMCLFSSHDVRMRNKLFLLPFLRDSLGNYRSVFEIYQEPPSINETVVLRGIKDKEVPSDELYSELICKIITTLPVLGRIDFSTKK